MYILDRETVRALLQGNAVVQHNLANAPAGSVRLSAITETQIRAHASVKYPSLLGLIDGFMMRVPSLPWDTRCAQKYSGVIARMPPQTWRGLTALDLMAAAHVLCHQATLVSADNRHDLVPGLMRTDWTV